MATTKTKTTAGAATANGENGFDEDHDQITTDAAKQAESEQSNEELEASQVEGKEHHHIMAVEPKVEEEEVTQIDPQLSPIIRKIAQEEKDMETACPEKESRSEEGQQSAVTQQQDFPEKISSQEEVQKMPQEKSVVKFEEDGNSTEGGYHSEVAQPQELHDDGKATQLVDASIPGYTAEAREDIRIKEESDEEDTNNQPPAHTEAKATDPAVASETIAAAASENLNAIAAEEIFFDAQQQQQEEETKEHADENDNVSFKDAPDVEMEKDTASSRNSKSDTEQVDENKVGNSVMDDEKQKDTTNEHGDKKSKGEEATKTINNNATKEITSRTSSAFKKDERNKARLLYSHASRLEKSLKTAKEELADSKDTLEDVIDQHMEALRSFTPADTHIETNDVDEEWNKMYHLLAKYKTEYGHLPSWKEIYSSEQKEVEHEKKKDEQPNRKGEEQKGNEGEQHTRTEAKDDNTKGEQDPTKKDDATKQDKENDNDKEEEEEEHLKSKEEVEVEPNDDKQEVMEDKLEVTVYEEEAMDNKQEVTEDYQKVMEDYQKVTEDYQKVTEDKHAVMEDKQEVTEDKQGVTKEKQEMMQDRQDNVPEEENDNTRKTNEFDKMQDEQQEESSQKKKRVDEQQPKEIGQQPNEESAQEKRDGEEQTMEVEHQKGEGMQQTREKENDDKIEKIINVNKEGNKTSEQENEEGQRKLLEVEQEVNGDEKALKAVEQDEKSSGGSEEDVEIAENKIIRKEQRQQSDQHGKRALMIWMMDQRNKYEDCLKHPLKFGMDYYKMKSLQDVGLLTEIVNRWKGKCPSEADDITGDNEQARSSIIIAENSSEWKSSNDTNNHESKKEEAADGERNVSKDGESNVPASASTREQKKHGRSQVNVGSSTPSKRTKVSTPPYPVSPYPSYPKTTATSYSFPSHLSYYHNATSGGYRLGGIGNICSTGYYGGNGFDYQGMMSSPLSPRQQQQWYDYNQRSMYIQQQQQQEMWALGQSLAPHSQSQWDSYNVATPSSPNVVGTRSGSNGASTFSTFSSHVKDGTTSPSTKQTQEGVASKRGRGRPRKYPVTSETPILPSTPTAATTNFERTNESAGKSSHRTAVV